jgi:hypothetical protein
VKLFLNEMLAIMPGPLPGPKLIDTVPAVSVPLTDTVPEPPTAEPRLNSDLQINRHIDAGGATPSISRGSAVGGSGTVSVSGTDTAGTVSINFGPGSGPGIIANISFRNNFTQAPHVVITPVGSSCADLNYYINRSTGGFSIASTNAGSAGSSCAFDYIAID